MSTRHEYAPALLRAYAQALSASGWGTLAAQVQALAVTVEHRPPSAAQLDALHAAGYVTGAGTLTPDGWAVLAQVLDAAALPPEGER
ncbi:hypothetical protein [Deinococcus radiodurans]|uniref:hypothetical protein n=1 Tax=Deinococcus radiodurans TaxID=1299 RepID=UPI00030441A0|nr:hypothetical protein [Deinococcus radiodurans]ANC72226.1 hypothetical protein A2G07_10865 [Deinococcus radiodurans R1 = ATCC 13939 = DSM 20539]QEM72478.1 hypothetical protein DXG80_12335 [Deinococcus radiodurans]QIP28706.1 hypothetical protein HAV23_05535 [Deinococcus radiodurans]UDK99710.1 hypothetical protein E5E91_02735 [Deinococcus radiodurans R1 = ATCC 13939 = DSM 20539]UID69531.1 hypothetical protein DRO_0526 [Deinococcus radiodurans R1 = ATCC 13939 = DSM 20539]